MATQKKETDWQSPGFHWLLAVFTSGSKLNLLPARRFTTRAAKPSPHSTTGNAKRGYIYPDSTSLCLLSVLSTLLGTNPSSPTPQNPGMHLSNPAASPTDVQQIHHPALYHRQRETRIHLSLHVAALLIGALQAPWTNASLPTLQNPGMHLPNPAASPADVQQIRHYTSYHWKHETRIHLSFHVTAPLIGTLQAPWMNASPPTPQNLCTASLTSALSPCHYSSFSLHWQHSASNPNHRRTRSTANAAKSLYGISHLRPQSVSLLVVPASSATRHLRPELPVH
ncbi:hypothetical protein PUNSTDRAFT_136524 [Punctularia strigosozonata HHB-11173 SS5]|uniref:uncharacterized protein n=1 Tax=Punctularia strigosozonata (strain HHB-11173) TaxID=741275 RepID=UPI0004417508|nr:uncharacterized protein PUNSTDRAFT_136524 [Punctularia strigosozonata HHB-11173 SS5]EIN06679.1 hypothetical protein PUNSTDRAFT_136524 [Punctularia strigosozonata HHB-11173 SS5]